MLTDDLGIDNSFLDETPVQVAPKSSLSKKKKLVDDLRLQQNACRKRNHQQVVEEDKRVNNPIAKNSREPSNNNTKDKKDKDEDEKEENYLLTTTAEQAEAIDKRKHRKKKGTFGWEMFNEGAHHNSYKRRLKDMENMIGKNAKEDYRKAPPPESIVDGVGQAIVQHPDESLYGIAHKPDKQGLDRMVGELQKADERRNKFSRRRESNPSADVTYINERNKIFNKKIARAFDQYTVEIRQNLERGTAL